MPSIKHLDSDVINKIAAGEVVQRPASVLKELVENSIDAGSTKIDINILDSGKTLIEVSDNGKGMSKDDLELCYLKHTFWISTPKIFEEYVWRYGTSARKNLSKSVRCCLTEDALFFETLECICI